MLTPTKLNNLMTADSNGHCWNAHTSMSHHPLLNKLHHLLDWLDDHWDTPEAPRIAQDLELHVVTLRSQLLTKTVGHNTTNDEAVCEGVTAQGVVFVAPPDG